MTEFVAKRIDWLAIGTFKLMSKYMDWIHFQELEPPFAWRDAPKIIGFLALFLICYLFSEWTNSRNIDVRIYFSNRPTERQPTEQKSPPRKRKAPVNWRLEGF